MRLPFERGGHTGVEDDRPRRAEGLGCHPAGQQERRGYDGLLRLLVVATGCLCSLIATVGGLIVLASGPRGGGVYVGALSTVVFLAQTAVVAELFSAGRNGD